MGMSVLYGPSDPKEVHKTLEAALKEGSTLWDTADIYGADGANEKLLAPYLKEHRDKIFLCTKFGFATDEKGDITGIRGDAEWVQQACEQSLKRLGISTIDLYYQHRVDPNTPIEETVGAMKKLQEQGKIRYIGLSECSAETLQRALKVARIDAVQIEYSPWTLDIETNGILQTCKENNITVVAYSPLGRGMLSGTIRSPSDFAPDDFRATNPRFQGEAFKSNLKLVDAISEIARKKGVTPSQLTLAWLLKQSDNVIAIPGTRKVERLEENFGAASIVVTDQEDREIRKVIQEIDVVGARYDGALMESVNK
jgi:aryl-alcohol dehydrogenase-like predicted oxidoreductase